MKQEKYKNNTINLNSREYPMKTFYGNISPSNQKQKKSTIKLFPNLKNGYNNESPDFFRMDSMRENQTSYKNPYLNTVKTIDRSLFYKNNQTCIKHINLINLAKSKREFSQNTKILKELNYSTDINILENSIHKHSRIIPCRYKNLSSDFDNIDYIENIKILNAEYLPNHHYLTKNSFDLKKINEIQMRNSKGFTNINFNKNTFYNYKDNHNDNDKDNSNDDDKDKDKDNYNKTLRIINRNQQSNNRINNHFRNFSQENMENFDIKNKTFINDIISFDKENLNLNFNKEMNIDKNKYKNKNNNINEKINNNDNENESNIEIEIIKKNNNNTFYQRNINEEINICNKK
jgi:hypothetical protein